MENEAQPKEKPQEEKTELQKLKDNNAAFEVELNKAREMRSEKQKLEAENLLSGTAGGHVEPTPAPVETPKEYSDKVMKGEIKAQ